MDPRNPILAEFLYDLTRVEVKARSLPYSFDRETPNKFPREDSYLLVDKDGNIIFWVPGNCNDIYVQYTETGEKIYVKTVPYFCEDETASREMLSLLFNKKLHTVFAEALVEIVGKEFGVLDAFIISTCDQRADAAIEVVEAIKNKSNDEK